MPLFEIKKDDLVPFRRVNAGPELYETEIEDLFWSNIDALTGRALFLVAKQPRLPSGGKPDLVALDDQANVIIIEIKRDIERNQLAQALEYAGWAKQTNLDQLSDMFHLGQSQFFADWTEFTGTDSPRLVSNEPKLYLVARDLHKRTDDALHFLTGSNLPIEIFRVTIYTDADERRFIDVKDDDNRIDVDNRPIVDSSDDCGATQTTGPVHIKYDGRRVQLSDLIDGGLLTEGETLSWERPRVGTTYHAKVTSVGGLQLDDGRIFSTPSKAAAEAAGKGSFDGWNAWRNSQGQLLFQLRKKFLLNQAADQVN